MAFIVVVDTCTMYFIYVHVISKANCDLFIDTYFTVILIRYYFIAHKMQKLSFKLTTIMYIMYMYYILIYANLVHAVVFSLLMY